MGKAGPAEWSRSPWRPPVFEHAPNRWTMKIAAYNARRSSSGRRMASPPHLVRSALLLAALSCPLSFLASCGDTPAPERAATPSPKPAEPAIPAEIQAAAEGSLGSETTVLAFGDLAKTGTQQILAANVVPKTPKEN